MQVYKIYPVHFASNCYLLTSDGKTAVAIDPSQPRVLEEAEKRGLKIEYILLTHGHWDHIGGCGAVQKAGAKLGCLKGEDDLALFHHLGMKPIDPFTVDFTFEDGDILSLCGMDIKVMATPGHTAGSVCFLIENYLFSGDTLFAGDAGRTDLPTSSEEAMQESLKKLRSLTQNYILHPGHYDDSTLDYEKQNNWWLKKC